MLNAGDYRYKMKPKSELVQLKLNIKRFYVVKYAMGFGGGFFPTEEGRRKKEPQLIEVGVSGI